MNIVGGQLYYLKVQTYFSLIKNFGFELAAIAEYLFQISAKQEASLFVLHFSLCKEQYNNMLLVVYVYDIDFFLPFLVLSSRLDC